MSRQLHLFLLVLSCKLVRRKVPLSFHVLRVAKFLELVSCYPVFHCVDRRLDFILITWSLKVSTKASISIVDEVSPIVLTCTSVCLAANVYMSATVIFSARVFRSV